MASLSGISLGSGSTQEIMDQRKRKRMVSNRESARRSRMRKQKHLDDLSGQVSQLNAENRCVLTNVNVTTQMYLQVEADNSVLRAQFDELTHRLNSLNQIIEFMCSNNNGVLEENVDQAGFDLINGGDFLNPWNLMYVNQPITAAADMFMF